MQTLRLVSISKEADCVAYDFNCDFVVLTAGDGLWGCEAGRRVRVTGIHILHNSWTEGSIASSVHVAHDTTWDIYTDTAFERAISDAIGFSVGFTEQGMQEDNLASMEA